ASGQGIAAAIAVCVLLGSRPSADAMRPIISGVRNCIMSETRLMAIGFPPLSLNWKQTFPSGASEPTTESQRRLLHSIISWSNDKSATTRECVLAEAENLRDPCQGFHRADVRFFPHRLSGKPLIPASAAGRGVTVAPSPTRVSDRKADERLACRRRSWTFWCAYKCSTPRSFDSPARRF